MADAFGAPPPRRVPAWLMRLVAPYVALCTVDTSMRVANTKAKSSSGGSPPTRPTGRESTPWSRPQSLTSAVDRCERGTGRRGCPERRAVSAAFTIAVGTRESPCRADRGGTRSRRAVHGRGRRRRPAQRAAAAGAASGRCRQHPVGVVGVQPHALPLQVGQRSVVGRSCRSPASASASAWRTQLRRASGCTLSCSPNRQNVGRGSDSRYSRTAHSRSSSGTSLALAIEPSSLVLKIEPVLGDSGEPGEPLRLDTDCGCGAAQAVGIDQKIRTHRPQHRL
jgi:hypothetical protein